MCLNTASGYVENESGFRVRSSHIFISVATCNPFTDFPSYIGIVVREIYYYEIKLEFYAEI